VIKRHNRFSIEATLHSVVKIKVPLLMRRRRESFREKGTKNTIKILSECRYLSLTITIITDSFSLPYKYYYIGLYIERDTSILYVTNLDNYSKLVLAFYFQHQNDMQLHLNTLSSTSPRYCTRYPPSNSSLSFVSRLM